MTRTPAELFAEIAKADLERREPMTTHDYEESEGIDEIIAQGCGWYAVGALAVAALVIWCGIIACVGYLARWW